MLPLVRTPQLYADMAMRGVRRHRILVDTASARVPRVGEIRTHPLVRSRSGPPCDSIVAQRLDTDHVMNAIRLFLVDDEPHVRRGLRMRLEMEPDFEIVGESGDAPGALAGVRTSHPDVVLLDIELLGLDGIQAAADLARLAPESAVVMVSLRDDPGTRAAARAAGASAFVGKHEIDFALTRAIRSAAAERRAMTKDAPM